MSATVLPWDWYEKQMKLLTEVNGLLGGTHLSNACLHPSSWSGSWVCSLAWKQVANSRTAESASIISVMIASNPYLPGYTPVILDKFSISLDLSFPVCWVKKAVVCGSWELEFGSWTVWIWMLVLKLSMSGTQDKILKLSTLVCSSIKQE